MENWCEFYCSCCCGYLFFRVCSEGPTYIQYSFVFTCQLLYLMQLSSARQLCKVQRAHKCHMLNSWNIVLVTGNIGCLVFTLLPLPQGAYLISFKGSGTHNMTLRFLHHLKRAKLHVSIIELIQSTRILCKRLNKVGFQSCPFIRDRIRKSVHLSL